MQWSSAYTGAKACHAPTPTMVCEDAQMTQMSGTSSRRQATVGSAPCQGSMVRCPTPKLVFCLNNVALSKTLEKLAREGSRVQGQPADKVEDSETSDEPLLVPNSARVVSRNDRRLCMVVKHLSVEMEGRKNRTWKSCEDTRSTTELSNPLWGRSSEM